MNRVGSRLNYQPYRMFSIKDKIIETARNIKFEDGSSLVN